MTGRIVFLVGLFATIILSDCASVRSHRTLSQPSGVTLTASAGSTRFRLNKTGDLPNVFGARDIWGGES